jgi:hypothetical protein
VLRYDSCDMTKPPANTSQGFTVANLPRFVTGALLRSTSASVAAGLLLQAEVTIEPARAAGLGQAQRCAAGLAARGLD